MRSTAGPVMPLPSAVLLQAVAEATSPISVADALAQDQPLVYVNAAFEQVTGYLAGQVLGRNCRLLQGPHTGQPASRQMHDALAEQRPLRVLALNRRPDGQDWWNELHLSYVRDAHGTVTHVLGLQHDVTEQVHAARTLQALAYLDPLTGLPNRHQLEEHLTLSLARADRNGTAVALLLLDLDGFKAVNDTHGHATGDALLREFGQRLREAVRGTDLVARWGGDEFVVLLADLPLPEADGATGAVVAQIRRALQAPFRLPGARLRLDASIGQAEYPAGAATGHDLMRLADQAMYRNKTHGGARVPGGAAGPVADPAGV